MIEWNGSKHACVCYVRILRLLRVIVFLRNLNSCAYKQVMYLEIILSNRALPSFKVFSLCKTKQITAHSLFAHGDLTSRDYVTSSYLSVINTSRFKFKHLLATEVFGYYTVRQSTSEILS